MEHKALNLLGTVILTVAVIGGIVYDRHQESKKLVENNFLERLLHDMEGTCRPSRDFVGPVICADRM